MPPLLEQKGKTLAGVAQLVGHLPVHWKVADSIPSQGTCPSYGLIPGRGQAGGSQSMFHSHMDVSFSPFL